MDDEDLTQAPEVRDERRPHFWIYDDVVDQAARTIGPDAFAAYAYLCRRADKGGASFPSLDSMGHTFGRGRLWALRQLRVLEDARLIRREARYRPDGGQTSSRYIILGGVSWGIRGGSESETGGGIENETLRKTQKEGSKDSVSKETDQKVDEGGAVREVFDHWVSASGKAKAQYAGRAKIIRTRLQNFTADQLKAAIDSAHRNPFFSGNNDRNTYYGDITTIFRTDEKVEQHLDWAEKNPPSAPTDAFARLPFAQQEWYLSNPGIAARDGITLPRKET